MLIYWSKNSLCILHHKIDWLSLIKAFSFPRCLCQINLKVIFVLVAHNYMVCY